MSYDTLMQILKQNSNDIYQRRMQNTAELLNLTARAQYASPALAPRGSGSSRSGRNKVSGGGHGSYKLPDRLKGLRNPLGSLNITDGYGMRINPVTHRQSFHTGVDLSASMGTPVRAAAAGIVKQANPMTDIYGNQVILGHGRGFHTMYGHMEKFVVKPGERVKKGQIIGYVGSTGWSTGPHLHFETTHNGQNINPMKFL